MNAQWIDAAQVERRLGYDACIAAMRAALRAFSAGDAVQPLRTTVRVPDGSGTLYVMPAYAAHPQALVVKLITAFEANAARGAPTHNGIIAAFDPHTGELRALIDAAPVTAIRTAAVSAVATHELARDDARTLALLGSGVQARSHLRAISRVRTLDSVRVWSRTPARAAAFAAEHRMFGARVEAVADAERAVDGADIICTVTSAHEPVLHGSWVAAGTHINAVGASSPHTREVDSALVARSRVFVDSAEAARVEAGDLLIARAEGRVDDDFVAGEIGQLLAGTISGRRRPDDVTLFKSLGLAIEDAAATAVILATS